MNLSKSGALVFKIVSIATIALPSLLAFFIFFNVILNHRNQVRFDEFYIVKGLEKTGHTQEVLVRHIFDEMHRIRVKTSKYSTIYTKTDLISADGSLDIDVAGSGLSLKTIIGFVEQFFGFKPNIISGEVISIKEMSERVGKNIDINENALLDVSSEKGKPAPIKIKKEAPEYRIVIRTTYGYPESYNGNIDELIKFAAQYVLKNIEPLTLGLYLDSLGKYEEMEKVIQYVGQTKNDDNALVVSYLLKSYLNYGRGDLEAANKFASLSLKEKPEDMFALGNIGYLMTEQGRYEEALPVYKKMLKIAPQSHVSVYTNVAEIYLKIHKDDDALVYIQKAISVDASDYVAYLYKGEYLRRKGKLDESMININIAKEIFSDIYQDSSFSDIYRKLREDVREAYLR